jgi:triacylglycerol lipase
MEMKMNKKHDGQRARGAVTSLLIMLGVAVLSGRAAGAAHASPAMSAHTLSVGDKTLAYLSTGAGPSVVIVHGVGGHKEDWQGVAIALAKTHRVFAIDMLGFGASSKNGDDLSMPVQASAIKALLDHEHVKRADLVGNSVGGWVTATVAANYPKRVHRLILIDAAGFKAMFEGPPPVNFDPGNAEEMQKLIDITINSDVGKTPGLAQQAYDRYVASGEKAISATWSKSLFQSPRLEELFPKITAPTLVLWGADDKLFPAALAGSFSSQIAGSQKMLIPNAGHFPQIDNPSATTAAIVEFLN